MKYKLLKKVSLHMQKLTKCADLHCQLISNLTVSTIQISLRSPYREKNYLNEVSDITYVLLSKHAASLENIWTIARD